MMIKLRTLRENKNEQRVFMGKPEGKRPPRRPRYRWEDNTKMNLGTIWHKDMKRIHVV
jgi:hypothetical protein